MIKEREHIIQIINKVEDAVLHKDLIKLKDMSNQTIHSASIEQNPDSITLAVIVYSLSKILERTDYQDYSGYNSFMSRIKSHFDKAIDYLEQDKDEQFGKELEDVRKEISKLTGDFKRHVQNVFQKASINKASRIYEHGISMEKTAKLLGVTIWELAEYAGQTGIADVNLNITMPVKQRIKLAMDFFK